MKINRRTYRNRRPQTRPASRVAPTPKEITGRQILLALIFLLPFGLYLTSRHRPHLLKSAGFLTLTTLYSLLISLVFTYATIAYPKLDTQATSWQKTVKREEAKDYSIYLLDTPGNPEAVTGIESQPEDSAPEPAKVRLKSRQTIELDCNLQQIQQTGQGSESDKYLNQSAKYYCQDYELLGEYSKDPAIKLKADGFGQDLSADEGSFILPLATSSLAKESWQKSELNFDALSNHGITKTINLTLHNQTLGGAVMAAYVIDVKYNFTQSDVETLKTQHKAYKDYLQAEKDLRAQEKRDKELAEQQERDRIAQEEANRLAAEHATREATQQAEALRTQQEQQAAYRAAPQQPSQPTPQSNPAPAQQNSGLPLKAQCKDGTFSYRSDPSATNYQGVCSNHGGIANRLGRVP